MREIQFLNCPICGRRLSLRELWHCLIHRGRLAYPFQHLDGSRRDEVVDRICAGCQRRAERHRARQREADDAAAAPGERQEVRAQEGEAPE